MKQPKKGKGYLFKEFISEAIDPFDRLLDLFKELVTHASGDVEEALDWMKQLDKEYNLTSEDYTLDDFVEELKKKGYLQEETEGSGGGMAITAKTEQAIRQKSLEQIK